MTLRFSARPGPRERHLARKWNNPLFPVVERTVEQADIDEAARRDRAELAAVKERFEKLVRQAIDLPTNAESETVLRLKADLDRIYVEFAGMPGNQREVLEAVTRLIDLIMQAVRKGAAGDPKAEAELDDEKAARGRHRELAAHPLVADLMRPDSPIVEDELVPALLSEEPEAVAAALWLFEPAQIADLKQKGQYLLGQARGEGHELTDAWKILALLSEASD